MTRRERATYWLLKPSCTPVLRDVVTVFMLGQGIIRLIDGRLFVLPVLPLAPDTFYGHMQLFTGILLLATRWRRDTPLGGWVAAGAAGVCAMLALATLGVAATSAWGAVVLMALSINEAFAGLGCARDADAT